MRHATLLVVATLTALIAASSAADARRRLGPGTIFGILTAPIRMMTHHRAYRHRSGYRSYARARHHQAPRARPDEQARTGAGAATPAVAAAPAAAAVAAAPAAAATAPAATPPASFNPYEDMLGYALWPNDYAGRFWALGYGEVMRSVISPASAGARAPRSAKGEATAGMCAAQAKERAGSLLDRVEQTITLTEEQRVRLLDLRTAVIEAFERGQAACRDAVPATPTDRLKAMMDGLWAMRDADILFRTPLDNFYQSLTDEQKAKLGPLDAATASSPRTAGANQVCSQAANDMPIDEIARSVRPTDEQRGSLEMLRGMSADLSKYLAGACPQEAPQTPVARLDAAGNRVNAMLYAAMNLDPVLSGFYFQLSSDQKKKFDSIGR